MKSKLKKLPRKKSTKRIEEGERDRERGAAAKGDQGRAQKWILMKTKASVHKGSN